MKGACLYVAGQSVVETYSKLAVIEESGQDLISLPHEKADRKRALYS